MASISCRGPIPDNSSKCGEPIAPALRITSLAACTITVSPPAVAQTALSVGDAIRNVHGRAHRVPSATRAELGDRREGLLMQDLQLRDHLGCRQGIVQKPAGYEAAVLGTDEPFVQGRTDCHGESAAHLAVEQGWVQNSPSVVQAHILFDANRAGVTVDFDPPELEDEAADSGAVDLVGSVRRF